MKPVSTSQPVIRTRYPAGPGRWLHRAASAARAVALIATIGLVGTFGLVSPAAAAGVTPTLSAPHMRTGFGTVTLHGTASPGAKVVLYESAISINDMQPADDWEHGGGLLTVTANSHGRYRIVRYVDTGFMFAVKAGGRMSAPRRVLVKVLPRMELSSTRSGVVRVRVEASPNEDGLRVQIRRHIAGGRWVTVASGVTNKVGVFSRRLAAPAGTTQSYRAFIGGDRSNGIIRNHSGTARVRVR